MIAMLIPPKKGRKISYTYSPAGFASIITISFSLLGRLGARKSRKSMETTLNSGTSTTRSSPRQVGTSSRSSP